MQIYISKAFSAALSNRTEEDMKIFNNRVNILKGMNKTEIIEFNDVIELDKAKNIILYAYNIQDSIYVLFAFKDKNMLVLLDEIELIGKDSIKSLTYPNEIKNEVDDKVAHNNSSEN